MDSRNWIHFEGLEGFEGSQGILMNSVDFDQNRVPQLQKNNRPVNSLLVRVLRKRSGSHALNIS